VTKVGQAISASNGFCWVRSQAYLLKVSQQLVELLQVFLHCPAVQKYIINENSSTVCQACS
jgi:hypothetical protein